MLYIFKYVFPKSIMKWIYLAALIIGIPVFIAFLFATGIVAVSISSGQIITVGVIIGIVAAGIVIFFKWPAIKGRFSETIVRVDYVARVKEYCLKTLDLVFIPAGLPQYARINNREFVSVKGYSVNGNHVLGVEALKTPLSFVLDRSGDVVGPSPHQQINPDVEHLNDPFGEIRPKAPTEIIMEKPAMERIIERATTEDPEKL